MAARKVSAVSVAKIVMKQKCDNIEKKSKTLAQG